jgi:hypothetical protein
MSELHHSAPALKKSKTSSHTQTQHQHTDTHLHVGEGGLTAVREVIWKGGNGEGRWLGTTSTSCSTEADKGAKGPI